LRILIDLSSAAAFCGLSIQPEKFRLPVFAKSKKIPAPEGPVFDFDFVQSTRAAPAPLRRFGYYY